jgi:uncharacterized membrane protein
MNNLNWPLLLTALLPWGALAVAALISPRLTRPDLFFAVTVSPTLRQSPDGRRILRRYDAFVILVSVAALSLIALAQFTAFNPSAISPAHALGIQLAGMFAAFLMARKRVRAFHVEPSSEREVSFAPRDTSLPGGVLAQAGPFLILAGVMLFLWSRWDHIPERFAIHWDMNGQPDGWAHKNPGSVFVTSVTGVIICSLMAFLCYSIVHGVRRIHSTGAKAAREARFLRIISFYLLATEYWLAVLMGYIGLTPLRPDFMPGLMPVLVAQTVLIAVVFLIAYRTGQGGWKLATPNGTEPLPANAAPVGDRTPDQCWKLGVFYFNRNDPAVFVEKRFGIGWTLNFASPRAVIILGSILLLAAVSIIIPLLMAH